jgi:hypothetical protein
MLMDVFLGVGGLPVSGSGLLLLRVGSYGGWR